jgi:hypothetical protein
MNQGYKPSSDFVSRVMKQVYAYEASKVLFIGWFTCHPYLRYVLVGGGALFGIFKAVPAF